jgi:hypothetical protein
MLNKFFEPNHFGRDFICGDLHGQLFLLEKFLEEIKFDPKSDRMFSVGDLVDRGKDSFGCLRLLNEPWFHSVKGNHEQLMETALSSENEEDYKLWMYNGGKWSIFLDGDQKYELKNKFLPFIKQLPLCITVALENGKKFHIVHAEILGEENETITDDQIIDPKLFRDIANRTSGFYEELGLIWGRDIFRDLYGKEITPHNAILHKNVLRSNHITDFFNDKLSHIFSGHTPVVTPTTVLGQTNIDTMAFGIDNRSWASLTVVEPLTNSFWKIRPEAVTQVQPIIL